MALAVSNHDYCKLCHKRDASVIPSAAVLLREILVGTKLSSRSLRTWGVQTVVKKKRATLEDVRRVVDL